MDQNAYETDELLAQYLEFHYGSNYFHVENYPKKCAELCLQLSHGMNQEKALDLGCAVGRTSFELAKGFNQVIGIDLSKRFIDSAKQLQTDKQLNYRIINEGELMSQRKTSLAELQLDAIQSKVTFYQEDACHLASHHKNYDLIFAGNLLDRLANPKQFLSYIHQYLNIGGLLVMSSPYTLLNEFTTRENWLGGFLKEGQEVRVLEGINTRLEPHFEFMNNSINVPFVIRETQRKFQHTIAELNSWKRIH